MAWAMRPINKWKAKYSGMEVNEAWRLRDIENENRKLKKLVADLSSDKMALEELLKKIWAPSYTGRH